MQTTKGRTWLGIILIVIGGLYVLDNFGLPWFDGFNMHHLIFSWHSIFLIIGIILIVNHRDNFLGYIFIAIGLFGLTRHFVPFFFNLDFVDLWPILLLVLGLWLILKRNGRHTIHHANFTPGAEQSKTAQPSSAASQSYDYIDEVCFFNSINRVIHSENFRGGKITTIFGETKLDLTNAKLAPGENNLEITTIFGGIKVRAPQNWKILVNVTSVFGGFDDKRWTQANLTEGNGGFLIIRGVALFGGGELLYQ